MDPLPPLDPTFATIQAEIFTPTCATSSCHDSDNREGGLCLEEAESYAGLIDVEPSTIPARQAGKLRVDPGNPDNSFLLDKVEGPGLNEGARMPNERPALSAREIEAIRTWIAEGALP
jgi:hypothetical protein